MGLTVGYLSFATATLAYLGLAVFYLLRGRWGGHGPYLLAAALLTAAWGALSLLGHEVIPRYADASLLLQQLAMVAWVWLLWHIIASLEPHRTKFPRRLILGWAVVIALTAATGVLLPTHLVADPGWPQLPLVLGLAIAVLGLSLTETLYRGYQPVDRWGVKFLCLGTGGLFAYDVFLYGEGLLFGVLDPDFLEVRGFAQALVAPLFAINIRRSEMRHFALGLSQRLVFGSTVVIGAGLYLALMAASAFYVRSVGGAWGSAVQIVFLFAAVLLLSIILLSGAFRARLRRFLSHHVLQNKYDYRGEWLRFTERLARADSAETFDRRVVRALADIVDSPAGALWNVSETHLSIAAGWNVSSGSIVDLEIPPLVSFFGAHDQVWEIGETAALPDDAPSACHDLVAALRRIPDAWVLIPLRHQDRLVALLLLTRPRSGQGLSPEDSELLQVASHQAAGYLSEQRAAGALAEAREFEKFNQRYAFVTHDIKNLVSQLSLMIRNAEKHGDRPEFQRDMLATIQSAVGRMNHLMERLKTDVGAEEVDAVAVKPLIEQLIGEQQSNGIAVGFECPQALATLQLRADTRRVDAILRHLLQNAVDAAGSDGRIVVGLRREKSCAVIEVRDSGNGMDLQFIRNELFKPFRSTKRGGMGIGAFQCRAYARELGGDLEAISSVGAGTTMRVTLPVLREA
ncbi:MAG: PEP-CTERM system histidine kinase PrsK [Kiloniellaceae bacterium]|nr:PEP-CTERM system histidine kinase PrsK [Kiloniellaceae bacterium]